MILSAGGASTAQAVNFTNTSDITIPDSGPATPYPSTIAVSGLAPPVRKVTLTIDITHTCMSEVEVLLVGPQGQKVLVMADASDCLTGQDRSIFTFDDDASSPLNCDGGIDDPTGTYRPTDCEIPGDPVEGDLPAPAPAGPYASALSAFNGTNPNGTWSLYVRDANQLDGGAGTIASWTLSIDAPLAPAPTLPVTPLLATGSLVGCAPGKSIIRLSAGDDFRSGTAVADLIFAAVGNDVVDALAGDDCIDLGPGNDQGFGGSGRDLILGGLGGDLVLGGTGDDRLRGDAGNDRLRGEAGNDRESGGSGNDRLLGGTGGDRLFGDSGNDRLLGEDGQDRISGSSGRDRINGGRAGDRLLGGSSADAIAGDAGNDRIDGGSSGDSLKGRSGGDRIKGGGGRDRISAGSGNDSISARDGRRDRISCGTGRDRVAADRIDRVASDCERVRRR